MTRLDSEEEEKEEECPGKRAKGEEDRTGD
jgi:hypothetical protein